MNVIIFFSFFFINEGFIFNKDHFKDFHMTLDTEYIQMKCVKGVVKI